MREFYIPEKAFRGSSSELRYSRPSGPIAVTCVMYSPDFAQWPFDHPEWIFELKYDGFRSLAVIQNGRTQLIAELLDDAVVRDGLADQ